MSGGMEEKYPITDRSFRPDRANAYSAGMRSALSILNGTRRFVVDSKQLRNAGHDLCDRGFREHDFRDHLVRST